MQAHNEAPSPPMVLLPMCATWVILWQLALQNYAIHPIGEFGGGATGRVNEESYQIFFHYPDNDRRLRIIGNPMPDGWKRLWAQFVMTNRCDHFAGIMQNIVKLGLENQYGSGVRVRWLRCLVKPISRLLKVTQDTVLPFHSVLEIILPSGESYILDGTLAQFGYDPNKIWLLPRSEYETRFVAASWCLWEASEEYKSGLTTVLDNGKYWSLIKDRMVDVWTTLDIDRLIKLTPREICEEVAPQAQRAFEGIYREAYPNVKLG